MNSDRKYFMSAACHDGSFVAQGFSNTFSFDEKRRESELRVNCCQPMLGKTEGWVEMTIYRNYYDSERTLQQSIALNRKQAEALRDLLNKALGGSSREARTIQGSIYGECHDQREVK